MSLSLIKELWSKIQKQEINTDNSTIPLNEDLDKNNIINNEKDNILKINKFNNSLIAEDYKFIHDFFILMLEIFFLNLILRITIHL